MRGTPQFGLACLVLAVTAIFASLNPAAAAPFTFSDNFNDGDISDWTTVTGGTGVVEASTNRSTGGGIYSMRVESIQSGDRAYAQASAATFNQLDYTKSYTIDFDFSYDKSNDANGFHWIDVMVMNAPGGTTRHVSLYLDTPGTIDGQDALIYRDATPSNQDVAGVKEDVWYHLAIDVDPSDETYDLTLTSPTGTQHVYDPDGQQWVNQLVTSDIPFMGSGCGGGFFPFRLGDDNADGTTYDHGEAYWDNIDIAGTWVPEPASVLILLGGGLVLTRTRRRRVR
jgi:hypothetical protein